MATPWEIDTAVYEEKFKSIGTEDGTPFDVVFSTDGTKMYFAGYDNATVYQYSVSTPWDVETAVYADKSKGVGAEVDRPYGMTLSSDGEEMYVVSYENQSIFQYTLSTPWDVATATYNNKFKDISAEEISPDAVFLKPDGTKMYCAGANARTVFQYSLSTPGDVSTATYEEKSKYTGSEDINPYDIHFKPDGNKMYILGYGNDKVYQYALSTPWGVDTATYEDKFISVRPQDDIPRGLCFKSDGTKMYISGDRNNKIYQYDLSFEFLQATLSIAKNESDLSIAENKSVLSVYENESDLTIKE